MTQPTPSTPPPPTYRRIPLPPGEGGTALPASESFVDAIDGLLSAEECAALLRTHDAFTDVPGTISKRSRVMFDDGALASRLWARVAPFYADQLVTDEHGARWRPAELNTRFRLARYQAGGGFAPHHDGRRLATPDSQAFMTLNIYLNSVGQEAGGATRFLAPDGAVLLAHRPVMGCAAAFRDALRHDGEVLALGEKFLLRTDVMFERVDGPFDFDAVFAGLGREEQAAEALKLAAALEDAGNHGEAVAWYRKAYRLDPSLEGR
ncbi:hypothetical protein Q8F55_002319 [Vanrija albida]|uniref:Prolyl 4-hydroxylase alpha subunit domain-containing protein n=1 Tax=Vanrija albida TaxID=181172 RepID=A0ABR3Q9G7_9TREE